MRNLIAQAASQYQGQDRDRFLQLVQQEPMFAAQLRAPLYEDKVVDFLFSKADITDRTATREQLEADLESEEGHVHGPGCGHDHHEKPKAKKSAKKPAAKGKDVPAQDSSGEGEATKSGKAPKKVKLTDAPKAEAKPAKPLKSEPANKAAAKAVEKAEAKSSAKAAKPAAKPKKPAKKG
jgi:trigger factor